MSTDSYTKEDRAAYNKFYKDSLKDSGLCVECRIRRTWAGHVRCKDCHIRNNDLQRLRRYMGLR